jgi:hypothetical protein
MPQSVANTSLAALATPAVAAAGADQKPPLPPAPIWPATDFVDATGRTVRFPQDKQASFKGCPDSWVLIFLRQKQSCEHMDMFRDCVVAKGGGIVGMAYRNYMRHVLDGVQFDEFDMTAVPRTLLR